MLVWVFYNVSLLASIFILYFNSKWMIIWMLIEIGTYSIVMLLSNSVTPRGVESTVKYFITQGVASVILLVGVVLGMANYECMCVFYNYNMISYLLIVGSLLMKLAVFPNPFWFVDVMSGVSMLRSVYVMILSKLIPAYLFFVVAGPLSSVVVVGLVSVVYGSFLGVNQTSMRKIMAFSSMSHMGWFIVSFPLLSGIACIFIFSAYVLMLLPLIWVLGLLCLTSLKKCKKVYFSPPALLFLLLCFLSLGGFPPLLGFFYKWVMFCGMVNKYYFATSGVLMVLSLVSLFFYLQVCFTLVGIYWPNLKASVLWGFYNTSWDVSYFGVVACVSLMFVVTGSLFLCLVVGSWGLL